MKGWSLETMPIDDKNIEEERPGAILGISEKEEMEIIRELRHLEVDLRFSDLEEIEIISKVFPNLSDKDKLKVLHFSRMSYWWGFNTAEEKRSK